MHDGPVVAIDGPAGSGKSTVAQALAERLGLAYLDTGAMYRAVAFAALRRGIDPTEVAPVARLVEDVDIVLEGGSVTVDGADATIEIRGPEVTRAVSAVAANPDVRRELVRRQREWVASHGGGAVVEGRDIGTVVFPEADLKAFFTARLDVRAGRRAKEVSDLAYEDVAADIARRDAIDSEREADPLVQVPDAVVIDTTDRSVDDIVEDLAERLSVKPLSAVQRAWYAVVRTVVVVFSRIFWRLRVEGTEHVPSEGPFILSPVHRSNIDTPIVAAVTRRPMRYMGKDAMWKYRASAWFFTSLGGFPVHRGSADREALRSCMAVLEGGEALVMFPEGTRQSGPVVAELFDGPAYVALRTRVPIVPVGIGGSERAMPRAARMIRPARVTLVVGPPIVPEPGDSGARAPRRAVRELTEQLRKELQRLFDEAQVKSA